MVVPGIDELIPQMRQCFEVKLINSPLTLAFYTDDKYSLLLVEVNPDLELHLVLGCLQGFNIFLFPVSEVIFLFILAQM